MPIIQARPDWQCQLRMDELIISRDIRPGFVRSNIPDAITPTWALSCPALRVAAAGGGGARAALARKGGPSRGRSWGYNVTITSRRRPSRCRLIDLIMPLSCSDLMPFLFLYQTGHFVSELAEYGGDPSPAREMPRWRGFIVSLQSATH